MKCISCKLSPHWDFCSCLWLQQTTLPLFMTSLLTSYSRCLTASNNPFSMDTFIVLFKKLHLFAWLHLTVEQILLTKQAFGTAVRKVKPVLLAQNISGQLSADCNVLTRTRNCLGGPDRCSRNQ